MLVQDLDPAAAPARKYRMQALQGPIRGQLFATVQQSILTSRLRSGGLRLGQAARSRAKVGVFVHGFNTNFQEAVYRLAQMAADADVDGVPILFAWPSAAKATRYAVDKEAVTYSWIDWLNL